MSHTYTVGQAHSPDAKYQWLFDRGFIMPNVYTQASLVDMK